MKQFTIVNFGESRYTVNRIFRPGGWFEKCVNEAGGEEVCQSFGVDKLIRDNNSGLFYLVNEIKDIEIIEEPEVVEETKTE